MSAVISAHLLKPRPSLTELNQRLDRLRHMRESLIQVRLMENKLQELGHHSQPYWPDRRREREGARKANVPTMFQEKSSRRQLHTRIRMWKFHARVNGDPRR
ncbi:MAG: hypothetical protein DMG40_05750 [Acidobacteria bacterium]|nr:MAG: hypothetical protein DMG40_05750 [Acidobacteriota bacterium]